MPLNIQNDELIDTKGIGESFDSNEKDEFVDAKQDTVSISIEKKNSRNRLIDMNKVKKKNIIINKVNNDKIQDSINTKDNRNVLKSKQDTKMNTVDMNDNRDELTSMNNIKMNEADIIDNIQENNNSYGIL